MCDRVMVILDGKLNAFDSFSHLRKNNQYYSAVAAHSEGDASTQVANP
jgi:hypothetical protein